MTPNVMRRCAAIGAVALLSLAATCQHGTPRHDTVLNLETLVSTLGGLQTGEHALYNAHTVPALTPERHQAINAKLETIWTAIEDARKVVLAWRPGQPIPPQLGALLASVKALLTDASTVIGAALPKEFALAWQAVTDILLIITGGGV
jgi:hypothetical protein